MNNLASEKAKTIAAILKTDEYLIELTGTARDILEMANERPELTGHLTGSGLQILTEVIKGFESSFAVFTIDELVKIATYSDFCESLEISAKTMLECALNFPDVETMRIYLSDLAISELNETVFEFEKYLADVKS